MQLFWLTTHLLCIVWISIFGVNILHLRITFNELETVAIKTVCAQKERCQIATDSILFKQLIIIDTYDIDR